MAAFDRIPSGYPGLDTVLDNIRLGDNVVWQVTDLDAYRRFAVPFAEQAIADGRNLIYIRFARHEPILTPREGLKIFEFDPDMGFEPFTVAIYNRITEEGFDSFYVFDCLSDLQSAWYTDQMMGNFFSVTCPYLFELDTVAYFPLLRGRHSFDVVARIRDTTQLLLDVSTNGDMVYLHPQKVWNRDTHNLFLPHASRNGGPFKPLDGGVALSRYYQLLDNLSSHSHDQNYDSHDRFFAAARQELGRGQFSPQTEQHIIESMMSRDPHMQKLLRQLFEPKDYIALRERMIGSGCIGGKACGMLVARKIAENCIEEYREHSEPHDSFYIGSDVFYTYIVMNKCWKTRIEQRTAAGYFEKAEELRLALLAGSFPENIRERFRSMLSYFGQSPIIVRSSSFLEDGFGNAFAGKYESWFCVNQGSPEKRLAEFEQAVKQVYASTMDPSALEYRRRRGLEDVDEQMSILVQRVSGSGAGPYYMPGAAGVGYSRSAYKWLPDMDPQAGMLRLVIGLGTKAVDRTEEDYPRLVNLDRPTVRAYRSDADKHRFSQHNIDLIDRVHGQLRTLPLETVLPALPDWYKRLMLEHDYEAEAALRDAGTPEEVLYVSCQGLLERTSFPQVMRSLLKSLENVYGTPVDIEYAVNTDEHGDFVINLLQCRPLFTAAPGGKLELPTLPESDVLFELRDSSMGTTAKRPVDVVVSIDPVGYYRMPYAKKPLVARAIGKINRHYAGSGKGLMLMTPGRLGTSSPELGVPASFADISNFSGVCEVSEDRAGYMPELSYGSHMFQDLVEADIFYCAVWKDRRTISFRPELLDSLPDRFSELCPGFSELAHIFRVVETPGMSLWMDSIDAKCVCGFEKNAANAENIS